LDRQSEKLSVRHEFLLKKFSGLSGEEFVEPRDIVLELGAVNFLDPF